MFIEAKFIFLTRKSPLKEKAGKKTSSSFFSRYRFHYITFEQSGLDCIVSPKVPCQIDKGHKTNKIQILVAGHARHDAS